ncbi:MAG: hypothetical protein ACK5R5_06395 [Alphaproteobacteria bacterium]|jgi:hypothetical protein
MKSFLAQLHARFFSNSRGVTLRKFPYPYRSAVAISDDAEFMTWEALLAISRLLSGPKGIGLPLSHSMFFFTTHALCHSSFSYFEGTSEKHNPYAPQIREMVAAGYIDTIHAHGDFDAGGFERKHAEQIFNECERHNMRFDVFTNHGSQYNTQNIGYVGQSVDYWQGDNPAHASYHLDLTRRLGVRFVWPDGVHDLVHPYDNTPLLYQKPTRDGGALTFFKRYRGLAGKAAPNISSLAEQMTRSDLDRLVAEELPCFYYQHFGVWTKYADGSFEANRPPYFTPEGIKILEYLAELYHNGTCWIVSASHLLRYLNARDSVHYTVEQDRIVLMDPDGRLKPSDLSGLTFEQVDPQITGIFWQDASGSETALPVIRIPSSGGKKNTIQIPWQALEPFRW